MSKSDALILEILRVISALVLSDTSMSRGPFSIDIPYLNRLLYALAKQTFTLFHVQMTLAQQMKTFSVSVGRTVNELKR